MTILFDKLGARDGARLWALLLTACLTTLLAPEVAQMQTKGAGRKKPASQSSGGAATPQATPAAPKKPYTKDGLLALVRENVLAPAAVVRQVQQRGVDFRLTPEVEGDFQRAGASSELLAAVRGNYRGPLRPADACPPVPGGPPLSSDALVALLQAGTQGVCVEEFVKTRGVSFPFTPEVARDIKAAGGTDALVGVISLRAPAAPPPAPEPRRDQVAESDYATGTFLVENGVSLKLRLTSPISTRTNREGDEFTAVVLDPSSYADATITGHIAKIKRSGKATGKTELELAFDSIRLPDGRRSQFAAQVDKVYQSEKVRTVDEEGNIQTGSKTKETATRSAGGAALGAIIGGLAGGGKGAAIGAAIGAGAGAGSVVIEGGKDLMLDPGTEILVRSAAPKNAKARPRN